MPKLTLLSRISDGLPLAASMEDEKDHRELDGYKAQAKKLLKTMSNGAPARVSVESGGSVFHYINQDGVCYMCLTEKSYPKRLAFNYLEELLKEFNTKFRDDVESASRPYAFIKFDTFIQRTKKLYVDTRTQRNLNKLNDDLTSVRDIMTQNIQDVLGRGEALDSVAGKSDKLRGASKIYVSQAHRYTYCALCTYRVPILCTPNVAMSRRHATSTHKPCCASTRRSHSC